MKILVVYDSKHGFTEKCVKLMVEGHEDSIDLWPLARGSKTPRWELYHKVVLGGPVYFGTFSRKVKNFALKHGEKLQGQHLALFTVSLSNKRTALEYMAKSLPEPLVKHALASACFGGAIQWAQLSWWEKIILKKVRDIHTDVSNLDLAEIKTLASQVFDTPVEQ